MDDGQELADVVGALGGHVVEHLRAGGDVDALVLHHAGVAAAGRVDGQRIEHGRVVGAGLHGGHTVVINKKTPTLMPI